MHNLFRLANRLHRPAARSYSSPAPAPRLENIGRVRAYAKPLATLFLWSALSYSALQAAWSSLYYDRLRLETEAKIDALNAEIR
ncbi:hypothetical protein LPJ53_005671, partial [Coemansia erecta]